MSEKKKSKNKYYPFKISNSLHGNIKLNFNNDPENDFMVYGDSFHDGARALRDKLKVQIGYSDADICPIVFLYRHALELFIKDMLITEEKLLGLENKVLPIKKEKIFSTHTLSKLVPSLKIIFKEVGWEWDFEVNEIKSFKDFKIFVESIDKIDPRSNAFRYPIDSNRSASLPQNFGFNVLEFSYMMDKILDLLSGGCLGLKEIWRNSAEAYFESLGNK